MSNTTRPFRLQSLLALFLHPALHPSEFSGHLLAPTEWSTYNIRFPGKESQGIPWRGVCPSLFL